MNQKAVLITGAAGGLGGAAVERMVSKGWQVFAADCDVAALGRFAESPTVVSVEMDVTSDDSVRAAFDRVSAQTDHLDGIVNFAGILGVGSLIDMDTTRMQRVLDVNLMGTFRTNKAFFPLVHACKGRIVNISSEVGHQTPPPFAGPYAISKHAIEAYTDALRRELALVGIKVIKLQPGPFQTEMSQGAQAAFERAAAEQGYFSGTLQRFTKLVNEHVGVGHPPSVLAAVVDTALTAKSPKAAYSILPDRGRAWLDKLPRAAGDRVWLYILRRGDPDLRGRA